MSPGKWPYVWRRVRQAAKALLWTAALIAVVIAANLAGIYFVGSIAGWELWLAEAAVYFFVWRLCLYAVTGYGWWWMRGRLLARETAAGATQRLKRAEIAGIVAIVALETSLLIQAV